MFKGTEQDSGLRTTFFHVGCCRIVVAGSLLQSAVVTNSAARFNFESAFGLSNAMVSVLYTPQLEQEPGTQEHSEIWTHCFSHGLERATCLWLWEPFGLLFPGRWDWAWVQILTCP